MGTALILLRVFSTLLNGFIIGRLTAKINSVSAWKRNCTIIYIVVYSIIITVTVIFEILTYGA